MPEMTIEQAKRRIGSVIRVKRQRGGTHFQPGKLIEVDEKRERVLIHINGHSHEQLWYELSDCRRWHSKDVEAGIIDPPEEQEADGVDIEVPAGHALVRFSVDKASGRVVDAKAVAPTSACVDQVLSRAAKRFGPENRVGKWDFKSPVIPIRGAIIDHSASPVPSEPAPDERRDAEATEEASNPPGEPSTPENGQPGPVADHIVYDVDSMEVWCGSAWGFEGTNQQSRWRRMTRQDARRLVTLLPKPGNKGEGRRLAADPLEDLLSVLTEPGLMQDREAEPGEPAAAREPEPAPAAPIIIPEPIPAPIEAVPDSIPALLAALARAECVMRDAEKRRDEIRGRLRDIKQQLESAGI